ncbi:trigger factor [Raineya orbicola]|jgi:trigger factor|uniref:Bacterial trigger factor protein (TF) n=1 Tax=Raineya orbicola TaxID=2016530 RepID=A0A2N3I787_9BACT|nr:trigger factor [Raineya orbicola]PKQ66168.1 Bacterial trigger factor protein (TF) [Raineya orbicola]
MEIVFEKQSEVRGKLSITLQPEDYLSELDKELKKIASKAHIKGFRPGKTPVAVVKNLYGNEILGDTVLKLFSQNVDKYLRENDIHFLGEPIAPENYDFPRFNVRFPETYSFQVEMALVPPFELKTEGIEAISYKITLSEEEKNKEFEAFLERQASIKEAQKVESENDFVMGNCTFNLESTEVEAESQTEPTTITRYALFLVSKLKKEAQEQFMGLEKGSEIEIYPFQVFENEEDTKENIFGTKEEDFTLLKDKKAKFQVERISRREKPELTESYFKQVFPNEEISDENAFKERILQNIVSDINIHAINFAKEKLKEDFIKQNTFEVDIEFLLRYLTQAKRVSEAEIKEIKQKPQEFLKGVHWEVLSNELIKKYNVEVTFEEVKQDYINGVIARVRQMGLNTGDDAWMYEFAFKQFKGLNKSQIDAIYTNIAREKAIDRLYEELPKTEKETSLKEFDEILKRGINA